MWVKCGYTRKKVKGAPTDWKERSYFYRVLTLPLHTIGNMTTPTCTLVCVIFFLFFGRFAQADVVSCQTSGSWSDPAVWNSSAPGVYDIVVLSGANCTLFVIDTDVTVWGDGSWICLKIVSWIVPSLFFGVGIWDSNLGRGPCDCSRNRGKCYRESTHGCGCISLHKYIFFPFDWLCIYSLSSADECTYFRLFHQKVGNAASFVGDIVLDSSLWGKWKESHKTQLKGNSTLLSFSAICYTDVHVNAYTVVGSLSASLTNIGLSFVRVHHNECE